MKKKKISFYKGEKELLKQVPTNYYQKGIKENFLQKTWHEGKFKAVTSLIKIDPEKILDVGSASGWFLSKIKKEYRNADCVGIDKYRDATIYGNKKYKNIKLVWADAHKLPFKARAFDLVICTEVLEHVEDPQIVLGEIKKVLSNDGVAIIEMDSGNLLFRLSWYWWTNMRKGVWRDAHVHLFNADKLERTIKRSGFTIKERKFFNLSMGVVFLLEKK